MKKSNEDPEHMLFNAIAQIKTAEEAKLFFNDLCTPAEISAMADRWHVVRPIKENIPYRQIYDETGVSATTVGRVAKSINYGSGGYDLIYDRVNRQQHEHKRKAKNSSPKRRAS